MLRGAIIIVVLLMTSAFGLPVSMASNSGVLHVSTFPPATAWGAIIITPSADDWTRSSNGYSSLELRTSLADVPVDTLAALTIHVVHRGTIQGTFPFVNPSNLRSTLSLSAVDPTNFTFLVTGAASRDAPLTLSWQLGRANTTTVVQDGLSASGTGALLGLAFQFVTLDGTKYAYARGVDVAQSGQDLALGYQTDQTWRLRVQHDTPARSLHSIFLGGGSSSPVMTYDAHASMDERSYARNRTAFFQNSAGVGTTGAASKVTVQLDVRSPVASAPSFLAEALTIPLDPATLGMEAPVSFALPVGSIAITTPVFGAGIWNPADNCAWFDAGLQAHVDTTCGGFP